MAAARFYSSTSGSIDLTGAINSSATSITVSTTTGLPGTTPFTLVLDPGTSTEEIVNVTNVSGLTLTVGRGVDGSSAQAHSAGVGNVRHMATARDFREPQEHIGLSAGVHGVTGSVVGTTDTQTLSNKTHVAATSSTKGLVVKGAASQSVAILDVQDSTGASVVSFNPAEGSMQIGSGQAKVNATTAANLFKYVGRWVASAADVVTAQFRAAASQTADIVQVQDSTGAVLTKIDSTGRITAPGATLTAGLNGTTSTLSGALTAASGAFSGTVSTGALTPASVASTGAVSGTTGTFSGAVAGSNIPSTIASASATKDKKRLHWGQFSGTCDASGFLTVTHGAGFTPTVVVVTGTAAVNQYQADTLGATTFRLRVTDAAGTVGAYTVSGYFLIGE